MKKLLALAILAISACNDSLNTIAPQRFTVDSWYAVSSGPNDLPFIRGMNPAHIEGGWKAFLNTPGWDDHRTITEREVYFKPDAAFFHLPFGRNNNEDFDFAGYTTSLKDPRLKRITDINEFSDAWYEYLKITGIKKLYFYYGYIGADHAVWDGLSFSKKQELVAQNLVPLVYLKKVVEPLNVQIGIIIDTLSQRSDLNDDNWAIAMTAIKSLGFLYGGEPWPNPLAPSLSDSKFMNVFLMGSTWLFDPDFDTTHGTWNTWSAKKDTVKGPLVPICYREWANNNYAETVEQFREKTIYSLKKHHHIAIPPPDDPSQTAESLKKLASQDGTQCITQHDIKSCCTSVGMALTCSTN